MRQQNMQKNKINALSLKKQLFNKLNLTVFKLTVSTMDENCLVLRVRKLLSIDIDVYWPFEDYTIRSVNTDSNIDRVRAA